MKDLIFIQAVTNDLYFLWQVEVQIVNFRKFNISNKMEIIVWYPSYNNNLYNWKELEIKYPEVKFFYYEDSGVNTDLYIPQIRPHSLKKHFKENYNRFKGKTFFYHDADIIFNFLPDFNKLIKDDICWESDTSSYLDYDYIKRKEIQGNIPENQLLTVLAQIGNITIEKIKEYSGKTGGAQVLLKNIDYLFWEDVERISIQIRENMFYGVSDSLNKKYFQSENEGLQTWCADMWAINFALWSRDIKTNVTKELDFSWATSVWNDYIDKPIMHNAGASATQNNMFYKGDWINNSPIGKNININKTFASYAYVQAINNVK